MFENVGKYIQNISLVWFVVNFVSTILVSFGVMKIWGMFAFLVLIVGVILSFVFSWVLFGFGEIVEFYENKNSTIKEDER